MLLKLSNRRSKALLNIICIQLLLLLDTPTGLYFMLNGAIHLSGASVLISDIGLQPADRSDPGSTFVCVTNNVNTACCIVNDNSALILQQQEP